MIMDGVRLEITNLEKAEILLWKILWQSEKIVYPVIH